MMFRHYFLPVIMMILGGVALTGCANYQLGTGADSLEFSRLYIEPVCSSTIAPQTVAPVSRAIRNAVLTGGRVTLAVSPAQADAVLSVELIDRKRTFTSVLPTDTALARKFDIALTVRCSLSDPRSGRIYFEDREITITRQIFVDGGQNPAEYQVVPQLAAELGDRISHTVLDVW